MNELISSVLIAVSSGAVGAAIVSALAQKWLFKAERKAKKEDDAEAKMDKTAELTDGLDDLKEKFAERNEKIDNKIEAINKKNESISEALKVILLDRIRNVGQCYIKDGSVSFDDRRIFHMMHDVYHNGLGGNGDADLIVSAVDELPLK